MSDDPSKSASDATERTRAVLDIVDAIPAGKVLTYGDIACHLGISSARQVGQILSRHGCGTKGAPQHTAVGKPSGVTLQEVDWLARWDKRNQDIFDYQRSLPAYEYSRTGSPGAPPTPVLSKRRRVARLLPLIILYGLFLVAPHILPPVVSGAILVVAVVVATVAAVRSGRKMRRARLQWMQDRSANV